METQTQAFIVTDYDNFLEATNAFLKHKKETSPSWSMGSWARRLNLSSTSSLSNILAGKKGISRQLGMLMVESMKLDHQSREYVDLLLEYYLNAGSSDIVKSGILARIQFIRQSVQKSVDCNVTVECRNALEILLRAGYLEKDPSGGMRIITSKDCCDVVGMIS